MRSRFSTSFPGLVIVPISSSLTRLPHRPALDPLLIQFALKDPLHKNAGRVNYFRIQFAHLDQVLDFGNRDLRGGSHHGIKIARRLAIHEIAPLVAFPSLDEGEIWFEGPFHHVSPAIELTRLLALRHDRPHAARSKVRSDTGACRANPFRKSLLRHPIQSHLAY